MTLVSAGPVVEVTVTPPTGFRLSFISITAETFGDFERGSTLGDYSLDTSGAIDDGADMLVFLYDDAPGSTTSLEFIPEGPGFTSEFGGAVFFLSGVLLHPQHLNLWKSVKMICKWSESSSTNTPRSSTAVQKGCGPSFAHPVLCMPPLR